MNLPSVKTLETLTSRYCRAESKAGAKQLRRILEIRTREALETALDSEEYPVTRKWYYSCYNPMALQTAKLSMADEVLGTYGVEYIRSGKGAKSPGVEYCNTGDSYAPTLMWTRGRYIVSDWGSIVERGDYE